MLVIAQLFHREVVIMIKKFVITILVVFTLLLVTACQNIQTITSTAPAITDTVTELIEVSPVTVTTFAPEFTTIILDTDTWNTAAFNTLEEFLISVKAGNSTSAWDLLHPDTQLKYMEEGMLQAIGVTPRDNFFSATNIRNTEYHIYELLSYNIEYIKFIEQWRGYRNVVEIKLDLFYEVNWLAAKGSQYYFLNTLLLPEFHAADWYAHCINVNGTWTVYYEDY